MARPRATRAPRSASCAPTWAARPRAARPTRAAARWPTSWTSAWTASTRRSCRAGPWSAAAPRAARHSPRHATPRATCTARSGTRPRCAPAATGPSASRSAAPATTTTTRRPPCAGTRLAKTRRTRRRSARRRRAPPRRRTTERPRPSTWIRAWPSSCKSTRRTCGHCSTSKGRILPRQGRKGQEQAAPRPLTRRPWTRPFRPAAQRPHRCRLPERPLAAVAAAPSWIRTTNKKAKSHQAEPMARPGTIRSLRTAALGATLGPGLTTALPLLASRRRRLRLPRQPWQPVPLLPARQTAALDVVVRSKNQSRSRCAARRKPNSLSG
mmetsp:Transcript_16653/g.47418  ORF Transcript_16653/g.47418 Transcript_16653/m.47418 type:complete len:325 (-) Transcript_16653:374-1348(-)